jgi:hypothetical protein
MDNHNPIIGNDKDPLASRWLGRVSKANKYYKSWSDRFKCNELEEYYYGFQHGDIRTQGGYEPYVINFVFSTIEVKKPTLLFQNVGFRVKPKPANAEFDFMAAAERARNREDALNTIVSAEDQEFNEEFESFVVDAFFRFGVMEIGYSANWIENPNAGKPILKTDNDPWFDPDPTDGKDNILREPDELPEQEKVYFKRIPPWRFRVGGTDGRSFKKCSWVGYYDFFRAEDIKANKALKNLAELDFSGARSEDFNDGDSITPEQEDLLKSGDLVKVWVIYDIRAKKKMIFADSQCVTLLEKKYKELPLVSIKFVEKVRGWYPVPLVFNWKSPQDEINESREQQRVHRRRAKRAYLYAEGTFVDDSEMAKLETGPDMTFAKTQGNPSDKVVPLQSAPLDPAIAQSMAIGRDDLNIITATSINDRGQSDRTTATQSTLIDQRSQIRDSAARVKVANILKKIGRLVLLTVQEHFTLSFWAKIRTDRANEGFLQEFREAQDEWKEFTSSDLGDAEDFEVDISLDVISPIDNEESKKSFIEFLSLLTNFPQLAFDPILVRETAYRCNYRNEKVIKRMAEMAQIAAIGQMEQAKASLAQQQGVPPGGGAPTNLAQTRVAQMQPPTQGEIQSQLAGQVGQ